MICFTSSSRSGATPPTPAKFRTTYAGVLGLNVTRFSKDIDDKEVKERVEQDQKRGKSLGVENAPTLFLDRQSYTPIRSIPRFCTT